MRSAKVFFRSAKCGAVPTPTTTRCTLGFGHRHLVFTFLYSLASEPTSSSSSWIPGPWWRPRSSRLTSLLCDSPRATESSYKEQRPGDTRHRPELTVVTWCKLWSTHLTLCLVTYWIMMMRNLTIIRYTSGTTENCIMNAWRKGIFCVSWCV